MLESFQLTVIGMVIYVLGALIIILPGVAFLEKFHKPGKLLRALEELEAGEIRNDHVGFSLLIEQINNISKDNPHLGENITNLSLFVGTVEVGGGGSICTIRGSTTDSEEVVRIEDPNFEKLRYQLDRKVRHGKTKIRLAGITLILIGGAIQLLAESGLVISLS